MQPIPVKVKNITIYKYFNPLEPLTNVISKGGTGTYSIGTLGLNSFYNLKIENQGTVEGELEIHGKYYATFEDETGKHFSTSPWLFCLDNSKTPAFGRTIKMLSIDSSDNGIHIVQPESYIKLGSLTDVTVSKLSPSIGQTEIITNGVGNIISTQLGTPHLMGVEITEGNWKSNVPVGSQSISITGKTAEGKTFSQTGYTVISDGKPAVFLIEYFSH